MLHLEINVKRRHIYVLVAAIALIVTILPVSSWAAHQFTDVPNSNIFHDDIGWLADNGITLGCNPPTNDEFCPQDSDFCDDCMSGSFSPAAASKAANADCQRSKSPCAAGESRSAVSCHRGSAQSARPAASRQATTCSRRIGVSLLTAGSR